MKHLITISILLLAGAGCTQADDVQTASEQEAPQEIHQENERSSDMITTSTSAEEPEPKLERFQAEDISAVPFENLSFDIPSGMKVAFLPSIQSLNVYEVDGEGEPIERSQIFIRFFDASSFLTLRTVTIHQTEDLNIGTEDYVARRYDIEKKPGIANFPGQPTWRNERHIVTDTRKTSGVTRYYVIAKNPELDMDVYEEFLESLELK